jgi:glycosyltransferase involved in cell wall biosynthesis
MVTVDKKENLMKICFFNPNLGIKNRVIQSIFSEMYKSFWRALELQSAEVFFSDNFKTLSGDVLIVPLGGNQERDSARAMNAFNGPVIAYVPPANTWFYSSFLKRWKHKIILAYGTDSSRLSFNKYSDIGIPYYHFPFASDDKIFKPLSVPKIYDIIFVGNYNTGEGRFEYIKKLIKHADKKKWEVLLIGAGWETLGHPYQIIAHGPLLNYIYNCGKICLNIHNSIQYSGHEIQMDANNRLFDLAMAGCFQINNAKDLIRIYFNKDEIVAEDNSNDWVECIEYFLNNESERLEYAEKARIRAISEHTWDLRAKEFILLINSNLENYKIKPFRFYDPVLYFYDYYFIPPYRLKHIRIIKTISELFGYRIKR